MANKKHTRKDAEIQQTKDWGVPNWKTKDGYPPKWDKLSPDQKKWEFLRRTKEYRDDWGKAQTQEPRLDIKVVSKFHVVRPFDQKALVLKYGLSHPISPRDDHKDLPKDFSFSRPPFVGGDILYPRFPIKREKGRKLTEDEELSLCAEESTPRPSAPKDWYDLRVWVEFDLSYSLDDQIKMAMKNLLKAKTKAKALMDSLRNPEGQYDPYDYAPKAVGEKKGRVINKQGRKPTDDIPAITLLRIFDARNCGRNNVEIQHGLRGQNNQRLIKLYRTPEGLNSAPPAPFAPELIAKANGGGSPQIGANASEQKKQPKFAKPSLPQQK